MLARLERDGVLMVTGGTKNNTVAGNYIGTNAVGNAKVAIDLCPLADSGLLPLLAERHQLLERLAIGHDLVVTIEENVLPGGFGAAAPPDARLDEAVEEVDVEAPGRVIEHHKGPGVEHALELGALDRPPYRRAVDRHEHGGRRAGR